MQRRWAKLEKDFKLKNEKFDISKIPDIYDCIKYDLQHNQHTLQFTHSEELYIYAKALADIVIPQEYGITEQEKLTIGLGICTPLLKKIRADLHRNIDPTEEDTETVNRLNPMYSHGVSSPERHVRTRLYFTSESHIHSLLTVLRYGGLIDESKDEQWRRAMEYVSAVSELNYMTQIVIMLYEDPTKDCTSEERFHVELHFSPGVVCCVQKNLPPGPGFRPQSRSGPESPTILEETESKEDKSPEYLYVHESLRPKPSDPIPIELSPRAASISGSEVINKPFPIMRSQSDFSRPRSLECENVTAKTKVEKESPHTQSLEDVSVTNKTDDDVAEGFHRHRHSIPGQLSNYLRMCSAADLPKVCGSSGSLFSTAIISGSSSAPELKNAVPPTAPEGFMSVPTIRPLETLHNALSLCQLDSFLERMTSASFRLPLQSSNKAVPCNSASSIHSYSNNHPVALPIVSPSNSIIWSGPPSFVSSSGPSSPNSSTLDIWTRLRQMAEMDSYTTSECSGPDSRNSYSNPPSPHDPRLYNNSL
ncbi:inositol hexakisphosphate and diphosphoinositol-pentakisphosphate kinase-like isoform X5 [Centruroides sculpturatus]|uniref:inositol hexakisphosphate and diphosphoinositol-pentakisphosphate kinase-like isoform X5 n=1 Tax=Centruroides sculpturatus TaxID=218467 RepID=UPI000C6D48F0|nr:inositol hexakisphosphate and diphosphoinositol-pentakisphosphate kinase-like isoform X5 [Centruroides sculpturatus]